MNPMSILTASYAICDTLALVLLTFTSRIPNPWEIEDKINIPKGGEVKAA
jgi:hypothetical protein